MSGTSRIEWTDATWSPVIGCSHAGVSCQNCYAERWAARLAAMGRDYVRVIAKGRWNGKTALVESALDWPLHRHKPKRIFICSMGDLFHESVPDWWIDRVMAIVALCPQHEFVLLTKQVERMQKYMALEVVRLAEVQRYAAAYGGFLRSVQAVWRWPLPNLTIGTSAGTQAEMDDRVPLVLATPAARRMLSLEPLLEAVDVSRYLVGWHGQAAHHPGCTGDVCDPRCPIEEQVQDPTPDWLIIGPETGPGRRPCDPAWIQAVVEQCRDAGIAVFVKAFPMPGNRISKDPAEWPQWAVREWPGKPGGKE